MQHWHHLQLHTARVQQNNVHQRSSLSPFLARILSPLYWVPGWGEERLLALFVLLIIAARSSCRIKGLFGIVRCRLGLNTPLHVECKHLTGLSVRCRLASTRGFQRKQLDVDESMRSFHLDLRRRQNDSVEWPFVWQRWRRHVEVAQQSLAAQRKSFNAGKATYTSMTNTESIAAQAARAVDGSCCSQQACKSLPPLSPECARARLISRQRLRKDLSYRKFRARAALLWFRPSQSPHSWSQATLRPIETVIASKCNVQLKKWNEYWHRRRRTLSIEGIDRAASSERRCLNAQSAELNISAPGRILLPLAATWSPNSASLAT